MPHGVGLLGERRHQGRVAMSQGIHRDAAGEVDQLATTLIPDSGTRTAHRNEAGRGIVGNHHLVEIGALHRIVLNGHRSSPDE
ncbi:hypothetical protein FQZ97_1217920 [compost metagenome]